MSPVAYSGQCLVHGGCDCDQLSRLLITMICAFEFCFFCRLSRVQLLRMLIKVVKTKIVLVFSDIIVNLVVFMPVPHR